MALIYYVNDMKHNAPFLSSELPVFTVRKEIRANEKKKSDLFSKLWL